MSGNVRVAIHKEYYIHKKNCCKIATFHALKFVKIK
jgi:hypothetical protein